MECNRELERSLLLARSRAETLLHIFYYVCEAVNNNEESIVFPYTDYVYKELNSLGFSVKRLNEGQLQVSGWFIEEQKEK